VQLRSLPQAYAEDKSDTPGDENHAIVSQLREFKRMVIQSQVSEPHLHAGCTAIVALKFRNTLHVANAGDSRGVLCRAGAGFALSAAAQKSYSQCFVCWVSDNLVSCIIPCSSLASILCSCIVCEFMFRILPKIVTSRSSLMTPHQFTHLQTSWHRNGVSTCQCSARHFPSTSRNLGLRHRQAVAPEYSSATIMC
jgi:Protein phosphatase 2C